MCLLGVCVHSSLLTDIKQLMFKTVMFKTWYRKSFISHYYYKGRIFTHPPLTHQHRSLPKQLYAPQRKVGYICGSRILNSLIYIFPWSTQSLMTSSTYSLNMKNIESKFCMCLLSKKSSANFVFRKCILYDERATDNFLITLVNHPFIHISYCLPTLPVEDHCSSRKQNKPNMRFPYQGKG